MGHPFSFAISRDYRHDVSQKSTLKLIWLGRVWSRLVDRALVSRLGLQDEA